MKIEYLIRTAVILFLGFVTGSLFFHVVAGGEQGWAVLYKQFFLQAITLIVFLFMAFVLRPKEVWKNAFYVGIHPYSFRAGTPAEIIGVKMITPAYGDQRACFHCRYEDGKEDFHPISDISSYRIISKEEFVSGKIPEVSH